VERAEAEAIYAQGRETVVAVLLALSARIEAQDAQIARLATRVEELERRLGRNSQNSSLPPSHDPPSAPARKRASGSRRKQGGQPGHPGHGRPLQPLAKVDRLVEHWPERCPCGHPFAEHEREPDGDPVRHQVCELPPIAVELIEYRLQRLRCPGCGRKTRAQLPAGVPAGAFGPRLEDRDPVGQEPDLPPRPGRAGRGAVWLLNLHRHGRSDPHPHRRRGRSRLRAPARPHPQRARGQHR